VREHGRKAEVRQVDLSDPRNGAAVVADLADSLGGIDALVNNAGTGSSSPFLELELDEWRRFWTSI
jgi:short-subunit dehydrogenase